MSTPNSRRYARYVAIILTVVLGNPLTAQADFMTGQQLLEKMKATSTVEDRIEATYLVGRILFDWEGKSHCKPPKATVGQAKAITQNFLTENPQLLHNEAHHLIGAALGIAWPCEN